MLNRPRVEVDLLTKGTFLSLQETISGDAVGNQSFHTLGTKAIRFQFLKIFKILFIVSFNTEIVRPMYLPDIV